MLLALCYSDFIQAAIWIQPGSAERIFYSWRFPRNDVILYSSRKTHQQIGRKRKEKIWREEKFE